MDQRELLLHLSKNEVQKSWTRVVAGKWKGRTVIIEWYYQSPSLCWHNTWILLRWPGERADVNEAAEQKRGRQWLWIYLKSVTKSFEWKWPKGVENVRLEFGTWSSKTQTWKCLIFRWKWANGISLMTRLTCWWTERPSKSLLLRRSQDTFHLAVVFIS